MQGINVVDFATLTVLDDAVSTLVDDASPTLPGKAKKAFITCETASVRWTADGTTPETTVGHILIKDDSISFTGADYRQLLEKIKFIAATATHGALSITYFD